MDLSITEFTILGIFWSRGPCTTYVVMRELAASPSSFYRNRAATAYRNVHSLLREGLLETVGDAVGARKDRPIRITEMGLNVLRGWLTPPLPPVEVAHTVDLIRLRMYFMGAVSGEQRASLLDNAVTELQAHLARLEGVVATEREADPIGALATLGSVYETRARLEWLAAVRDRLLTI